LRICTRIFESGVAVPVVTELITSSFTLGVGVPMPALPLLGKVLVCAVAPSPATIINVIAQKVSAIQKIPRLVCGVFIVSSFCAFGIFQTCGFG